MPEHDATPTADNPDHDTPETLPPPNIREGRASPLLLGFLILPLLGILVALVMIASEERPSSQRFDTVGDATPPELERVQTNLVDFEAPAFTLPDMNGEPISLDDYRGQPLFLNFWQTTCAPCVRELPAFAEFEQSQNDASVLAINFGEQVGIIRTFFQINGIEGVPVVLDADSKVRRDYGVELIPMTFVLDAEGFVRFVKLGEMSLDDMYRYLDDLNDL